MAVAQVYYIAGILPDVVPTSDATVYITTMFFFNNLSHFICTEHVHIETTSPFHSQKICLFSGNPDVTLCVLVCLSVYFCLFLFKLLQAKGKAALPVRSQLISVSQSVTKTSKRRDDGREKRH